MSAAEARPAGAGPFTARTVLAMILVGVFSLSAFSVLSTYAPDLRSGRDGRGHPLSRSADGFGALVALARDAGIPVRIARTPAPDGQQSALRILTIETGGDPKALQKAVAPGAYDGRTLVILPKWETTPDFGHPGWVRRPPGTLAERLAAADLTALPDGALQHHKGVEPAVVLNSAAPRYLTPGAYRVGAIEGLSVISGGRWRPILADASGLPVLAQSLERPDLFVLADPDLMNTQGLRSLERARLAVAILDGLRGQGPVVFDVTLNGFSRSRSLLKLVFEPPFLAATLCAAAAALLMGLHAAVRFGPARVQGRALALGKKALADNSAALLRLAKREPAMAAPYADLTRRAVAQAVGAQTPGRTLDKGELDALIDRMAVKAGLAPQAAALTAEAAAVKDTGALMALARKLYEFRRGMTRERN